MTTPSNDQFVVPQSNQSISRPFEGTVERRIRLDLIIKELEKEKREKQKLEAEANEVKSKIKAETDKIKQLKDQIATKKEQERIAAEAAALAAEQARIAEEQALAAQQVAPQQTQVSYSRGASSNNVGNRYQWGQCTWHVYNMRPDIGSFWGNANQWLASAQADGYATGSEPRVGAIGVDFRGAYGHVVYVTGVSDGGATISLSEMNYGGGVGVVNYRTDSAYNYMFIY